MLGISQERFPPSFGREVHVSGTLEMREIITTAEMNDNVPFRIAKVAIDSRSR
jgi:hypothetical protein